MQPTGSGGARAHGTGKHKESELGYAPSAGEAQLVSSFDNYVFVNDVFSDPAGSGYQLLSLELVTGGSGAESKVYGVRRGIPRVISVEGRDVQVQGERIILAKEYFREGGGHMLEWYELTFDQSAFALTEGPSLGVTELFELPDV